MGEVEQILATAEEQAKRGELSLFEYDTLYAKYGTEIPIKVDGGCIYA